MELRVGLRQNQSASSMTAALGRIWKEVTPPMSIIDINIQWDRLYRRRGYLQG
jgi:hypothetical protein